MKQIQEPELVLSLLGKAENELAYLQYILIFHAIGEDMFMTSLK
jgi:hypothetical protein